MSGAIPTVQPILNNFHPLDHSRRRLAIKAHFEFHCHWIEENWAASRAQVQQSLFTAVHSATDARQIGDVWFQFEVDYLTWCHYVGRLQHYSRSQQYWHIWPWGRMAAMNAHDVSGGISKEYDAWLKAKSNWNPNQPQKHQQDTLESIINHFSH
ncbi:hypothetical protein ACHAO7_007410 [Fusarium culmorum]|uniref:Uncharacterized protein n=1 Tax=Fusarium culmorum TaxID=5516 RepID=A0A2T4GK80_FUSCU|nr:hypothetical protein FCULG_00000285 [Fusarium culmorum]